MLANSVIAFSLSFGLQAWLLFSEAGVASKENTRCQVIVNTDLLDISKWDMASQIRVVTLNCWGVFTPGACSDRKERIDAIGDALASSDYDVVMLQEIWTQSDYQKLVAKLHKCMPYTHYFHSGMFGSGVCIFSKYNIRETSQHRFTLNGYAHYVHHGDWFGGKAICLAKMDIHGYRVNIYSTHLHAQYDEDNDGYLAHRVSQAYEMGQYIKMTSVNCDVAIVGGDFNIQPKELGYKLVIANANLLDSWLVQKAEAVDEHGGTTCDRPDNIYHSPSWVARNPHGVRLDYLLYRANEGVEMICEQCELTLRGIPGKKIPYSDHEGVRAVYTLKRREEAAPPKRDSAAIEEHFMSALPILDQGNTRVKATQMLQLMSFVICCILLLFLGNMSVPYGLAIIVYILRFVITIAVGYFFWMGLVMSNIELNGLEATRKDINNILRCNPNTI